LRARDRDRTVDVDAHRVDRERSTRSDSRKEVPELINDPMTVVTPCGPADHAAAGTASGALA
jgi:hypothetical protein